MGYKESSILMPFLEAKKWKRKKKNEMRREAANCK
jgi:hypothetical protein